MSLRRSESAIDSVAGVKNKLVNIMYRLIFILLICSLIGACSSSSSGGMPKIPNPESSPSSSTETQNSQESSEQQTSKETSSEKSTASQTTDQQNKGSPQTAQTDEEIVAVLDKQLEDELQNYDQQLHKELEQAEQEKKTQAQQREAAQRQGDIDSENDIESEAISTGNEQESITNEEQVAKANRQSSTASSGSEPSDSESNPSGNQDKGSSGTTPKDIPRGDDDDVVARQLREAAENEKDPKLREKLWDEYRKYKKQQASVNAPNPTVKPDE